MNTAFSRMRNRTLTVLAVLGLLPVQSCETSEPEGRQTPMKWQTEVQFKNDVNGMSYVDVPQEGGVYKFTCLNYKCFWLNYIVQIENSEEKYYESIYTDKDTTNTSYTANISSPWAEANVDSDTGCMTVTVQPNDSDVRKFYVGVESGNTFYTFPFRQRGVCY